MYLSILSIMWHCWAQGIIVLELSRLTYISRDVQHRNDEWDLGSLIFGTTWNMFSYRSNPIDLELISALISKTQLFSIMLCFSHGGYSEGWVGLCAWYCLSTQNAISLVLSVQYLSSISLFIGTYSSCFLLLLFTESGLYPLLFPILKD